jgi:hypothetical protein
VVIGGGLHHRVINNTFESCGSGRLKESACIHYDNRGMVRYQLRLISLHALRCLW